MTTIFSVVAALIAVIIACWQYREAARAKSTLDANMAKLPQAIAVALSTVVESRRRSDCTGAGGEAWLHSIEYVDIDGDGQKDFLVQYPSGAHGSALNIFAWREGAFRQIGNLASGTPVGFQFGDFDGDGKLEIRTEDTDWDSGLPYVSAPRLELLYRWNGSSFPEVSRKRLISG